MAYIQPRRNADGKITSYSIRVFRGLDRFGRQRKPYTTSFKVKPTWSEKTAYKKAQQYAAEFELKCKEGYEADNRQTFEEYAEYVLQMKITNNIIKPTTADRYESMKPRIYAAIGHMKLREIRPQHLNEFYMDLMNEPVGTAKSFIAKPRLRQAVAVRELKMDVLARMADCSHNTVKSALTGKPIREDKARAIAEALEFKLEDMFTPKKGGKTLSAKTVKEHHRFISSVLAQAEKELIVPYNAASRATPPKVKKAPANYYEADEIRAIKEAFDKWPIKQKTMGYMLIFSGARRGEIMGMEWHNVNWEKSTIAIEKNVLYVPKKGIYADTPKTETSKRIISLPPQMMSVLKQYYYWVEDQKEKLGWCWNDNNDFLFTTETGDMMHPDTISKWLRAVELDNPDLPHLNPHAFRHSVASALIYAGIDPVSVSKRLGHAQVSTTTNIYAHVMRSADERNAEVLEKIF